MIAALKISRIAFLCAATFLTAGVWLASDSHAGPQTPVAATKLKSPGKGPRKDCGGKTTTQCCEGLSYCGCLYMPGKSDDTHPTACFSNPPPKG